MSKLLYISANTKPENMSSSKTVARALINRFLAKYPNTCVEEVDLYKDHIPQLKYSYFEGRSKIINEQERAKLPQNEQDEVNKIVQLCDQFVSANVYVLAAPMWSLSFPAPVKEYFDCIVQVDKTVTFKENRPQGLLNDRPRTFIYVQSSGAHIPWILRPALNKGLNYISDIVKLIGISKFEELLVDGTGTTEAERLQAIAEAESRIDEVISRIEM